MAIREDKILSYMWIFSYFGLIALPINSRYELFRKCFVINNSITIFDLILLLLFTICTVKKFLSNKDLSITKYDILMLFYLVTIITYIVIGYTNYGISSFNDCCLYLRAYMFIEVTRNKIIKSNITIYQIVNITFKAMMVFSFIEMIDGINNINLVSSARMGANNESLYIFIVGFIAYKVFFDYTEKRKFKYIIGIGLFAICCILSKSRVFISFSVISFILVLIKSNYSTKLKRFKFSMRSMLILIFTLSVITIGLILFFNSNNILTQRFLGTAGESNTGIARINTFMYYINIFKKNIFGCGFGYKMYYLDELNKVIRSQSSYQIDNAFIVYAIKGGTLFLIWNIYLIINTIRKINYVYVKLDDSIIYTLKIGIILVIISSTIFTSQIIHGNAEIAFIWSLCGYFLESNSVISQGKKYKEVHKYSFE
ncbi:hypothetical protein [Clostridium butyricum]|uniref:hypothetical protein n=1 Tax=Clostridium butyricum TaxID=1492 RepID=UPI0032C0B941|nr:hypothetical protein [Clostridium butyricum]